jgi:hypothetical protein
MDIDMAVQTFQNSKENLGGRAPFVEQKEDIRLRARQKGHGRRG